MGRWRVTVDLDYGDEPGQIGSEAGKLIQVRCGDYNVRVVNVRMVLHHCAARLWANGVRHDCELPHQHDDVHQDNTGFTWWANRLNGD